MKKRPNRGRLPLLRDWKLPTGEPFKSLKWELEVLRHIRDHAITAYSLPRGNGKTGLLAQVMAFYGLGPGAVPGADVVCTAASLDQATVGWRDVADGLRLCIPNWKQRGIKIQDHNAARCIHLPGGGRVRALAANARTQHGQRVVLYAIDEPSQIHPESLGEAIFVAAQTTLGKIPNARLIVAGTRPASDSHWFNRLLQTDGLCWAAGKKDDPFSPLTWRRCNPSWNKFAALRKAIKREAQRAKLDPLSFASFKALRLNMGGSGIPEEDHLMDPETWTRCETKTPPPREGSPTWGLDLGGGSAMSSIAAYWSSGRLECRGWFPDTPTLLERGRRHGAGDLYQRMQLRGELRLTPGRSVPVDLILGQAIQLWGEPRVIACDRWKRNELLDALQQVGLSHVPIDWRGMGFKDGSEDLRSFMRYVLTDKVQLVPSLLLASAVGNARVRRDDAGNSKLTKVSSNEGSLIDSVTASIEAVAAHERHPPRAWAFAFAPADGSDVVVM